MEEERKNLGVLERTRDYSLTWLINHEIDDKICKKAKLKFVFTHIPDTVIAPQHCLCNST